jgi:hypothetical protein
VEPVSPFSLRDILTEIKEDVKDLKDTVDRIDRQGSIGTRAELQDHETRLRGLERFRYAVPSAAVLSMVASVVLAAVTIFH